MRSPLISTTLILAAVVVAFGTSKVLQVQSLAERADWPAVEEYKALPPASAAPVVYAWLGRQLAADITWDRALVYYGSSTIGESDFRYLQTFIDNIIALDPKFRRVYDWAANAVAWKQERATVEEFRTSVHYLERAIHEFPDDWELYQALALRYAYDLGPRTDEERRANRRHAAELLEHAARLPGAHIQLATMAANLRSKLGQRNRALAELRQMILTTDNPQARDKLIARYRGMLQSDTGDDEVAAFRKQFDERWHAVLPYAPADDYILLGDPPPERVDLPGFAPIRDLLSAAALNAGESP